MYIYIKNSVHTHDHTHTSQIPASQSAFTCIFTHTHNTHTCNAERVPCLEIAREINQDSTYIFDHTHTHTCYTLTCMIPHAH